MAFLLPALTEAKFSNQRDVVLNERRQNYENRPYGLAPMAMLAALFPPDHPYHWTTIGEIADLQAVQLDEVRQFFSTYYHPANASLALAGDIDADEALALARRYFEEIPPGPPVAPVSPAPARLDREARLLLEDRVELPRLYLSWISAAMFATATRISISRRTSWRTARPRACTGGWSSSSVSRPTCRPHRTRARSGASSRSPRRPLPGTRSRRSIR